MVLTHSGRLPVKTGLRLTLTSYVLMSYKDLYCTLWLFDSQSHSTCQTIAIVFDAYFKVIMLVFRLNKLEFNRDGSCWRTFKGKHFVRKEQTEKCPSIICKQEQS